MLSRGQEIAVEVDESQGSRSDPATRRIFASSYRQSFMGRDRITPTARESVWRFVISHPMLVQNGLERDLVLLVRGKDDYGNFEVANPPNRDMAYGESPIHTEALERKGRNLLPKGILPAKT